MNLQKAILILKNYQTKTEEKHYLSNIDIRALLLVTLVYLVIILFVPLNQPDKLIWFAVYPIIMSPLTNQLYSDVFRKSLFVLPFIIFIGIFNPFFDKKEVFAIGNIIVTNGWLSFLSIIVRGLLAFQALIILINTTGFIEICNTLKNFGIPKVLSTQLIMVYRFLGVLMEEGYNIQKAVVSRGYGKKSFPLKIWKGMVGSLLLRTVERSKRINNSMLSRGFDGDIIIQSFTKWSSKDSFYVIIWVSLFLILFYFNLSTILFHI